MDLESQVTREVVVRPANESEHAVGGGAEEELEKAPGLLPLDVDLGYLASPRIAQWAEQGLYIIARPWPHSGPLFTKHDFTLDFARMQGTWPGGQRVPMVSAGMSSFRLRRVMRVRLARSVYQSHARASEKPEHPRGRTVPAEAAREDEDAAVAGLLRKRTAVEHAIPHQLAHQGRRARYKGVTQKSV